MTCRYWVSDACGGMNTGTDWHTWSMHNSACLLLHTKGCMDSSMEHWPTLKCAEVMTNAPTAAQARHLWSSGLTRTDLDGCSWHHSKLTLQHTQHLHAHLKFRVSRNTMPAVMIRLFTFLGLFSCPWCAGCSAQVVGAWRKWVFYQALRGGKEHSPHPVCYSCPMSLDGRQMANLCAQKSHRPITNSDLQPSSVNTNMWTQHPDGIIIPCRWLSNLWHLVVAFQTWHGGLN